MSKIPEESYEYAAPASLQRTAPASLQSTICLYENIYEKMQKNGLTEFDSHDNINESLNGDIKYRGVAQLGRALH